jgi:hypothetical protein
MTSPTQLPGALSALAARATEATRRGAQAFARLLAVAESTDSGQARRVAGFVASTYNGRTFPLNPFELRAVDASISDDMLACLDALRWGRADLFTLVPNGDRRVQALIRRWDLRTAHGG